MKIKINLRTILICTIVVLSSSVLIIFLADINKVDVNEFVPISDAEISYTDDTLPIDQGIVIIYDEEIPLSNSELYEVISPMSNLIFTAIFISISATIIIFAILFFRRVLWDKKENIMGSVK